MKRPGPLHLRRDLSWVDLCPQHQVRSPTLDKGPHSLERKRRTHRTKAHGTRTPSTGSLETGQGRTLPRPAEGAAPADTVAFRTTGINFCSS